MNASGGQRLLIEMPRPARLTGSGDYLVDAIVVNGSTSNGIERRTIGNGRKGPRSLFNGGIEFRNFTDYLLNAQQLFADRARPAPPYSIAISWAAP